jgi:endonuclease III
MRLATLRKRISGAGLSEQKAPRIKAILKKIFHDFGHTSLDSLFQMAPADAEAYLCDLPGVHLKTAKCVLMYALGQPVLPVDTHVLRVAKRLELLDERATLPRANLDLEKIVPPELRYSFHVNVLAHGRELCTAIAPSCPECPLRRECTHPVRSR